VAVVSCCVRRNPLLNHKTKDSAFNFCCFSVRIGIQQPQQTKVDNCISLQNM